jgi:hypothetical protein
MASITRIHVSTICLGPCPWFLSTKMKILLSLRFSYGSHPYLLVHGLKPSIVSPCQCPSHYPLTLAPIASCLHLLLPHIFPFSPPSLILLGLGHGAMWREDKHITGWKVLYLQFCRHFGDSHFFFDGAMWREDKHITGWRFHTYNFAGILGILILCLDCST